MSATVEIIIKTIDEATKKNKNIKESFKELKRDLLKNAASITAGLYAMKKAFDFAEQGAQMRQLEAAGDSLGVELDALRRASNYTVSDFELLNATQTLLIGTSGELKQAMLGNSPKLLEIAKAANRLNPALGQTSFLYQSIATGIKRSSPLILDNLGLVVKVGEANEAYAEALGKSVGELTAQEKQMALLNATLEAGNVLIDQAAEVADKGADSYAQLTASAKNYWSELQKGASQQDGYLSGLGKIIFELERTARVRNEFNELLEQGILHEHDIKEASRAGLIMNVDAAEAIVERAKATHEWISSEAAMTFHLGESTDAMRDNALEGEDLTGVYGDLAGGVSEVTSNLQEMIDASNSNVGDAAARLAEDIAFAAAGGDVITTGFDEIEGLLPSIGDEFSGVVADMMNEIYVLSQVADAEAGNITFEEAAGNIRDTLGVTLTDAERYIGEVKDGLLDIDGIVARAQVLVTVTTQGDLPPTADFDLPSGQQGYATGGSFIVGGSGAADSQYVGFWASPGEQVTVSTPGQQEKESGAGVVNNYFYGAQINSQDSQMMDILGIRV